MAIATQRLLVTAPLILICGCTILEPDVEQFADLDAEIAQEVTANGIPSVSAWVVKDDAIVWERYYGYADVASRRPADRTTIYGLASISKLIVATAVMQLVEQGALRLDDDVNTHLPFSVRNPAFPNDPVTPRHLLTHSSGLAWPVDDHTVPGYYERYPFDTSPPLGVWLPDYISPSGSHFTPAVWKHHRPGDKELYSNIGVALLAYVVESITAMDFGEYCRVSIFEPLDMPSTSFHYADLETTRIATLYDSPTRVITPYRFRGYPSGDLKSTIGEFSHFMIAYMNGGVYRDNRILSEASIDELLETQNAISGLCLIWNRTVGEWYGHAGGKAGVSAYVEFQRDKNVGLMVVSNRHAPVYPGGRIHALLRRVAEEWM